MKQYDMQRISHGDSQALFECQRFKSKGNKESKALAKPADSAISSFARLSFTLSVQALATPQDEIAFIAMCPLACPSSPNKRFHVSGDQVPPEKNGGGTGTGVMLMTFFCSFRLCKNWFGFRKAAEA